MSGAEIQKHNYYEYAAWILFLLSTIYLIAEFIFNVRMLDVSGTSLSKIEAFDDIQYFGRLVSASGFTLLVLEICRKFKCRFDTPIKQVVLGAIIFLCMLPFFLSFGSVLFNSITGTPVPKSAFDGEMVWSFSAVIGLMILLVSKAEKPLYTVIGIIIMAWPAMFFGQKLLVERFIIEPTTWEQRLNAQYILMLRAGAEECIFSLDDLDLCDASKKTAELRSVNAVFGALVMNAPEKIIQDILRQKDKAIYAVAKQESLENIDTAYKGYLMKQGFFQHLLQEEHNKKTQAFTNLLYKEYAKLSREYAKQVDPKTIKTLSDTSWNKVDQGIQTAWNAYLSGVQRYDRTLNSMAQNIRQNIIVFQRRYIQCRERGSNCDQIKSNLIELIRKRYPEHVARIESLCKFNVLHSDCGISLDYLKQLIKTRTDSEFIKQSGYAPNLKQKSEFLLSHKTQALISQNAHTTVKNSLDEKGLVMTRQLPKVFTKETLYAFLYSVITDNAAHQWRQKSINILGIDIPPGLKKDQFINALLTQKRIKPLQSTPMTKDDFFENIILPKYKSEVVARYDKIQSEAPEYKNGGKKEEDGKAYVRGVYIPPIALGLSLIIALLTLGKNMMFIITHIFIPIGYKAGLNRGVVKQKYIYASFWTIYSVCVAWFIYTHSNPYVQSNAYKKYHDAAYDKNPAITLVIDGIVRAQPTIYKIGKYIETYTAKK